MRGIEFHYVPEDWLATDFNHGLGFKVGFFADTGSETTGKDYGFHGLPHLRGMKILKSTNRAPDFCLFSWPLHFNFSDSIIK
jgi:hypothetical protein